MLVLVLVLLLELELGLPLTGCGTRVGTRRRDSGSAWLATLTWTVVVSDVLD